MAMKDKPKSVQEKNRREEHRDFLLNTVASDHRIWIKAHPDESLFDLLMYLQRVESDLEQFDEDDILTKISDQLDDATEYLRVFTPFGVPVNSRSERATVGYRRNNVEEDIENVEELIEEVGENFPVKRLPKQKPRRKRQS